MHSWEDNIKINLQEIRWEGVDLSNLAQGGDRWQDLVNMIMSLWVPYSVGNFLTRRGTVSFSGRTLFVGVSMCTHTHTHTHTHICGTYILVTRVTRCRLHVTAPNAAVVQTHQRVKWTRNSASLQPAIFPLPVKRARRRLVISHVTVESALYHLSHLLYSTV